MQRKIRVQLQYGDESIGVIIKRNQLLEKMMVIVSSKIDRPRVNMRFSHNGRPLTGQETAETANLNEGDMIMMFDKLTSKYSCKRVLDYLFDELHFRLSVFFFFERIYEICLI